MDQLWAPWRMPFIENKEPVHGCIFCGKAAEDDDEKNLILFRAERCFVIMNLYPYNSGHVMVVPYQHVGQVTDLQPETGAEVFRVAQLTIGVLDDAMAPEGYNLGINQGKTAGAGIADHIHLHVVPRWNGDTNFMPVLAEAKVIPELLTQTARKLRSRFETISRG